jgi:hypothetical protein
MEFGHMFSLFLNNEKKQRSVPVQPVAGMGKY